MTRDVRHDPPPATSLSAARRERELAGLADGEVVDLLVVGLGVTGAGVALDAASRGLTVAAVDAVDLAFGTSRWSSKLVHGGLRYLARGAVGLARESAVERAVLMARTAPHLVRPLPFLLPLTDGVGRRQAALLEAGLRAGDLLRWRTALPPGRLPRVRRVDRAAAREMVPRLRAGRRGALLSWDGQLVDDARLVVALARTAAGYGARVLTRARVVELAGTGALVEDTLTGTRCTLRARSVVNATGVWAGELVPGVDLRPSRGSHLVLAPGTLGPMAAALTVPVPGERGRFVLVLPQPDGRVYVGLTDEPVSGPLPAEPEVPDSDVRYLLDVLGRAVVAPPGVADVAGTFAGLRPLLAGAAGRTADLSRRHAVLTARDGVVTVVGGKLTTYRRMAEEAVDAAVQVGRLATRAGPCRTSWLPLVGARPCPAPDPVDVPPNSLDWLHRRYGAEASLVASQAEGDPGLLAPVVPGLPVLGVELLWAARHEGALDEADLLDRRTRLGLVPTDRCLAAPAAREALHRA
ncbi:MAG: glycerol-3-phosphate dehydrogenase/oxidase [Actinomycetota bacterium]